MFGWRIGQGRLDALKVSKEDAKVLHIRDEGFSLGFPYSLRVWIPYSICCERSGSLHWVMMVWVRVERSCRHSQDRLVERKERRWGSSSRLVRGDK